MYEYIIGTISKITPDYIVLESNNIGYQIITMNPYKYSKKINCKVKIFIHHVIREDVPMFYGFLNLEEKKLYLRLITVSGIGPKSALSIMSSTNYKDFIQAIESENIVYLKKFPGVGKKSAQQIILDLKGKLGDLFPKLVDSTVESSFKKIDPTLQEAMSALKSLGYSYLEIKKVQNQLSNSSNKTTDEILRESLKIIRKNRRE